MSKALANSANKQPAERRWQVGQLFVNRDGEYFRVSKYIEQPPKGKSHYELETNRWGGKWQRYGDEVVDLEHAGFIPLMSDETPESVYREIEANPEQYAIDQPVPDNETTALVQVRSIETVQNMKMALREKQRKIRVAEAYLAEKHNQLRSLLSAMTDQIAKLQKIIDAFELYLGTHEQMVILRAGMPVEGPVSLRQMILYMDEEYGDPRPNPVTHQKGIDFQSVEDFDAWLLEDNHLEQVLPEAKGIVALKPSRQYRTYYPDSPWLNAQAQAENKMTYLLIRNGENLLRLWTSIAFGARLFPTQAEQQLVWDALDDAPIPEAPPRADGRDDPFYESHIRDLRKSALQGEENYRRNALIIQGLFDRTEMFEPLPHPTSLFKPETYEGAINFIRDDELTLDDGRLDYKTWKAQANAKIGVGSRILWVEPGKVHIYEYASKKNYVWRFLRDYANEYSAPDLPDSGIYQVEEAHPYRSIWHGEGTAFVIRYNPGDEVGIYGWTWDPHPRKNRVGFRVMATDDEVFNYDQIDLDDIEYYLASRRERAHFLSVIPVLWDLRDQLAAERAKEADFVKLVAGRLEVDEETVWAAVDWWKYKNRWKRRIDSDDAKALRMIESKIRRDQRQEMELE